MREYRILHIEDSETDSDLVKRQLQKGNLTFDYCLAQDKESYIRGVKDFNPNVILCDHTLQGFDSLEAFEIYQELQLEIPFILVTGTVSEEYAVEIMKKGIDDYILKSNLKRLPTAIDSAFTKRENERKVREGIKKLEHSELRMKEAQRIAHLGNWELDVATNKVLLSDEACSILGLPSVENVQSLEYLLSLVHQEDLEIAIKVINDAKKNINEFRLYNRIVLKDGTLKHIYSVSQNEFDENGKLIRINGFTQDITKLKLIEENLIESQEQFRLISENVKDMFALLDLEGRRLFSNQSLISNLGNSLGSDLFHSIHPDDLEKVRKNFLNIVKTGEDFLIEHRRLLSDGRILFFESQFTAVHNHLGEIIHVVVVSRDVTEKKNLENQFLRLQRMESIGTLVGGIAHDLNNILTPIMMSVGFLSNKITDERSLRLLQTVEISAKRGSDFIKRLLSFARGVNGDFAIVHIDQIVDEIGTIINETFPKQISLHINVPKDLPTIYADPTQLHQVLMNLCVNARDAMPDGGTIEIEAKRIVLDEHYKKMHIEAQVGTYIVITVTDEGHGIPPEVIERIYDPFFTTKEVGKGTGLGLSTVITIIKGHKGFMNVYSEVGRGTTFKIYLPLELQNESASFNEEDGGFSMGNGELILVVDDEVIILEITTSILESYGYSVITASNGKEAVEMYSAYRDKIELIITDMMMPIMDGLTVIKEIQEIDPKAKFIAVSGLKKNGNMVNHPLVSSLNKPYTTEILLKAVSELLKKG